MLCPARASAESGLLLGFELGPAIRGGAGDPATPVFNLGAGLDLIHATGPSALVRLDASHDLDLGAALLPGWYFGGARGEEGLPFALAAGPSIHRTARDGAALGLRLHVGLSLWYARALLELDFTARRELGHRPRPEQGGTELLASLMLRMVPWPPALLSL